MSSPRYCECGNKIVIFLHPGRNPKARRRGLKTGRTLKDHDLCKACWRTMMARRA